MKVENPALVIEEKQGTGRKCIDGLTCPHNCRMVNESQVDSKSKIQADEVPDYESLAAFY